MAHDISVALANVDRAVTWLAYASAPGWSGPAAANAEETRRRLVSQLTELRHDIYRLHLAAADAERSLVTLRLEAA